MYHAVLIFAFLTVLNMTANCENLISNGDFARGKKYPDNWMYKHCSSPKYDKSGGFQGMACVWTGNPSEETDVRQSGLSLISGEEYKMSCYFKNEGIGTADTKHGLVVFNSGWANDIWLRPDNKVHDWKYYEKTFIAPPSNDGFYYIGFYVSSGASGKLGICDIKLEPLTEKAKQNSKNLLLDTSLYKIFPVTPALSQIPSYEPIITFAFPYLSPVEEKNSKANVVIKSSGLPEFENKKSYLLNNGTFTVEMSDITIGSGMISISITDKTGNNISSTEYPYTIVKTEKTDISKIKQLNNLVSELLKTNINIKPKETKELPFSNPRNGWILISVANVKGSEDINIIISSKNETVFEQKCPLKNFQAMRYIPAGFYTLKLNAGYLTADIIIKSVPEIVYYPPGVNSRVTEYGNYDGSFMDRYVLSSCNVLIGGRLNKETKDNCKISGMRILSCFGLPLPTSKRMDTIDNAMQKLSVCPGFTGEAYDGVTLDEFMFEYEPPFFYSHYADCIRKLKPDNKHFVYPWNNTIPFSMGFHGDFISALSNTTNGNGKLLYESYCKARNTESEANDEIEAVMAYAMRRHLEFMPEAQKKIIYVIGNFVQLFDFHSLNYCPEVDYKYLLDMQFNMLANRSEFKELYGVGYWGSHYSDEETLRWCMKLIKHYAIDGNKEMLSPNYGISYKPELLKNCDFSNNIEHWKSESDASSIYASNFKGYGQIQKRWRIPSGLGDTFLVMVRKQKTENKVSQEIKNLIPGKLYSLQFSVADLKSLESSKTQPGPYALRAILDNVDIIPEKTFIHTFDNIIVNQFTKDNPFCADFHRIVFRAKSNISKLTLSDWASEKNPGGPIAQKLIINFVQMKPYFEE